MEKEEGRRACEQGEHVEIPVTAISHLLSTYDGPGTLLDCFMHLSLTGPSRPVTETWILQMRA